MKQTGLSVMSSAQCVMYQILREMFVVSGSKFPSVIEARSELEEKFGAISLSKLWDAFRNATDSGLSVILFDFNEKAICRKLAALAAGHLDLVNSGLCEHAALEHLEAIFELDQYFGGLTFPADFETNAYEASGEPRFKFTGEDEEFLRALKISTVSD